MTPADIACFVAMAQRCVNCGEVFDSRHNPHDDNDCPKNYALWEDPTPAQTGMRLYQLLMKDVAHKEPKA